MTYQIEYQASAAKALSKLPKSTSLAIEKAVNNLATNPRPAGATKLTGHNEWRIRVGDYRVIYTINDNQLVVLVVKVGHRSQIYRRLP